jgi:hypothetical protein
MNTWPKGGVLQPGVHARKGTSHVASSIYQA